MTGIHLTIQVLTCASLVGLLGGVGLRVTWDEVRAAVMRCRLTAILVVNFVLVPGLAVTAALGAGLKHETGLAMMLLAAAPFAPVVPVFTRMSRGDLALAAGLTAAFPLLSSLLTPIAVQAEFRILAHTDDLSFKFNILTSLATLAATVTLPLLAGILVRHWAPQIGRRLLRPVEIVSEATGAVSLAFVTITEFGSIVNLGGKAWLTMAVVSELSLLVGWSLGGPTRGTRQVVALGTSNRNIALALLIAIQNFPGTAVVSAVVGNGLLLIGLGLVHVAWWRFAVGERRSL